MSLSVEESVTVVTCPYCGEKIALADSDEFRIAKLQSETELERLKHEETMFRITNKTAKKGFIREFFLKNPGDAIFLLFLLIMVLLIVFICAGEAIPPILIAHHIIHPNTSISVPVSSEDELIGAPYKIVYDKLYRLGFERIELVPLSDLQPGSRENGNVKSITIDDKSKFSKKDTFSWYDYVIIEYHTVKE